MDNAEALVEKICSALPAFEVTLSDKMRAGYSLGDVSEYNGAIRLEFNSDRVAVPYLVVTVEVEQDYQGDEVYRLNLTRLDFDDVGCRTENVSLLDVNVIRGIFRLVKSERPANDISVGGILRKMVV